jgi:hypothetical protein
MIRPFDAFSFAVTGLLAIMLLVLGSCGHPITQFFPNAPHVVAVSPVNGTTGVAVNTTVTATFDKSIDPATINASSFILTYITTDVFNVNGSVSYDSASKTATFTPSADLSYATVYTAKVFNSVKSIDGDPLENEYDWSFTTADPP